MDLQEIVTRPETDFNEFERSLKYYLQLVQIQNHRLKFS